MSVAATTVSPGGSGARSRDRTVVDAAAVAPATAAGTAAEAGGAAAAAGGSGCSGSRTRSGQTPMWSGVDSSRTRSRMPSGRVISRGSWTRPARSITAYSTALVAAFPASSVVSCLSSSVLVRPSLIATVRRTRPATAGSWETSRMVTPSSVLAVCRASNTLAAAAVSSSPVGSSASSTRGRFASAVASAIRCCSPPESSPGVRSAQCATPNAASSSSARRARSPRSARAVRASRIGTSTFWRQVRYGSRLRTACCQMKPMTARR